MKNNQLQGTKEEPNHQINKRNQLRRNKFKP